MPINNEPDSKSKDIIAPKQEDTGESSLNEKIIKDKGIVFIPPRQPKPIIRHKQEVQSYRIINKKFIKKLPQKIFEDEIRSDPKAYRIPFFRYQSDERPTMDDVLLYGKEQSPSKEKDLDGDFYDRSFRFDLSKQYPYFADVIGNYTYKSHRDAHVYNPAQNVVRIPEINVKLASPPESSNSEASTSRSVSGLSNIKIHYEDPNKDSGISELEHFLFDLKSLSPTDSEASTSQANTRQAYQATKELSINPRIFHPVERRKLSDSESELSESEHSEFELSESEISESVHYNIEQKLVEDDTESGTAPNNNTDPPTLREDSTVSNGTSETPPQPNDTEIQNNGRKLMNTKPLSLEADTYELYRFSKNAMLIINQENVEGFSELRIGTEEDVNILKKTFGNYGFEAEEHKDKTVAEIFNILSEFSKRDFTDYGCIAIAILTHGSRYGLLRAKNANETYSEHSVLNYLNVSKNPTLLTKPIIVIIQACRGNDEAIGYRTNTDLNVSRDHDSPAEPYYLPLHSDTLVLHSSFYGKPSFRPDDGSWFIQTLCEKINLLSPKLDLASIITEVQKHVAIRKNRVEYSLKTKEMEVNKQMPVMTSTLIRKLYLMSGDGEKWQTTPKQLQTYDTVDKVCRNAMEHECLDTKVHCSCFIGHFNYLKNCLSHFVDENPPDKKDSPAHYLLKEANEIDKNYDDTKAQTTLLAISNFLQYNTRHLNCHKYLYFYVDINNHSVSGRNRWRRFCQNYAPIVAACIIIISGLYFRPCIQDDK